MKLQDWITTVLDDNRFSRTVAHFKASGEACRQLDRHVIGTLPLRCLSDASLVVAGCLAGIALLRQWAEEVKTLRHQGVLVSSPVLIIDEEWIRQDPEAPPPHVYVCMAATEESFAPVEHEKGTPNEMAAFPVREVSRESGALHAARVEALPISERLGAWYIHVRGGPAGTSSSR